MKIGFVTIGFPYLTQTFERREVEALRDRRHKITVFTRQKPDASNVGVMPYGVIVSPWEASLVKAFGPEVLYTGIGFPSHLQTLHLSMSLGIPFVLRIWSGLDTFTAPKPEWYSKACAQELCLGCVVEDLSMLEWATTRMAIPDHKISIVPNSIDLSDYLPRARKDPPKVVAIGRLVEKKGFIHLVRAWKRIERKQAELFIIGDGSEYAALKEAAGDNPSIHFPGSVAESDLPALYSKSAALVAPCVRGRHGDLDGVPTVVLEALAAGCPVITSNIGSAERYIIDDHTGILTGAGDEAALASDIAWVLQHPDAAEQIGDEARQWAAKHLDIKANIVKIEQLLGKAVKRAA